VIPALVQSLEHSLDDVDWLLESLKMALFTSKTTEDDDDEDERENPRSKIWKLKDEMYAKMTEVMKVLSTLIDSTIDGKPAELILKTSLHTHKTLYSLAKDVRSGKSEKQTHPPFFLCCS
jgi:hypothetical protein